MKNAGFVFAVKICDFSDFAYNFYGFNRNMRLLNFRIQFLQFLHSMKWNASLILLRDYGELGALCKVIGWKIHIPAGAQKWPPRLIFAGACHGKVINYGHGQ